MAANGAIHASPDQPQIENLSMTTFGPGTRALQTVRIAPMTPGRYELAVQLAPRDTASPTDSPVDLTQLSASEAVVKVYRHELAEPLLYRVGRNKKATVWWPFAMEIAGPDKVVDHIYKSEHYRQTLPQIPSK
jgi:hypothetical protein